MEAVLVRELRNSELNIAKDKRSFLTYPIDGLASCTLEETLDGVAFLFDTTNLEPGEYILGCPQQEQYRFLISCASLEKLIAEYDFSLSLNNLLVDTSLRPQVLMRNAHTNSSDFFERYKALLGQVLQPRYTYEDYLHGGEDLYRRHKLLAQLTKLGTIDEIKTKLIEIYQKTIETIKKDKCLVSRKNAAAVRVVIPVLGVALLAVGFFSVRFWFFDLPHKDSVIEANTAYIQQDYLGVQHALDGMELSRLSGESKYILAQAYVATEALTDSQKENILQGLTMKNDAVIFDYWISLGRLDFATSIDIAQRLGDNELLLFSYMKYEMTARNDPTLSGEEKTALLNELDGKISSLTKLRDEAAALRDEAAALGDEAAALGDEAAATAPQN